jgi:DNA-binding MarR family transcriptional regulator
LTAEALSVSPVQRDSVPADTSVSAWVRLLECHTHVLATLRTELLPECTIARFDLLVSLDRKDGQTLASLSKNLLVTAGNLTGLVDRASRDRLVVKRSDAKDRRVSRVYLTRKGRALVGELIPRHAQAVQRTFSVLAEGEQGELRRLLGKLRAGLVA